MKTLCRFFAAAIVCTALISATAWGQTSPGLTEQAKTTIEERLIRVEEGVKNLDKRIDDLRANLNARIDELRSLLLTGFGVMFAGMFALVGFVIWDRRTAIAPVARHTKELAEIDKKTLAALREFAKTNKVMQEALRKVGML